MTTPKAKTIDHLLRGVPLDLWRQAQARALQRDNLKQRDLLIGLLRAYVAGTAKPRKGEVS